MMGKCFICENSRQLFDKSSKGFEYHIKKCHYLWNYIFFIYSIQKKDPTEFNGIESYVSEKLEQEDISWIPNLEAIELEGIKQEELQM
mmetsp:Transcript_9604/g.8268  ORF Transcript_9604/g.8268 Transcript_9604/m.8268 type:complete len:88 (-) Transcript_9604:95-358(-)